MSIEVMVRETVKTLSGFTCCSDGFWIVESDKSWSKLHAFCLSQMGLLHLYTRALVVQEQRRRSRGLDDLRLGRNGLFPPFDDPSYEIPDAVEPMVEAINAVIPDWGYSQDYTTCDACYGSIRTSPDCYSWQPDYVRLGDGTYHVGCADVEAVKEAYMRYDRCLPIYFVDKIGVELDWYEHGYYGGQSSYPKPIWDALRKEGIDCWFSITTGQFDIRFWPVVERENEERARDILSRVNERGTDPAEVLKRSLKKISYA